jgi:metal transporter CNNM
MGIFSRPIQTVWGDQTLGETLKLFQKSHSHIAIVQEVNDKGKGDPLYETKGIITLEDIIEKIIGADISDETDTANDDKHSRKNDFNRLKLLNADHKRDSKPTKEELSVIEAYLLALPEIATRIDNKEEMEKLLNEYSTVIEIERTSELEYKPHKDDYMYESGEPSEYCTLILTGKIRVVTGAEKFSIIMGPWNLLGINALNKDSHGYIPDFSAHIFSEKVRLLKIRNPLHGLPPVPQKRRSSSKGFSVPIDLLDNVKPFETY